MTTRDLGLLEGPLMLFGGPYSNLQATEALRQKARELDIPASNIICGGDVVAYCAQPNETISAIRDWGVPTVMGNCEESIGWSADDCGCGFAEGSACDVLSDTWYTYTNARVEQQHRLWMQSLPKQINFEYAGKRFAVVHGSVSTINQFVFASTDRQVKAAELALSNVDGVIGGHCGLPFTEQIDDKLWHNPGVIGMPANDGTQRGWYSIWRQRNNCIEIEHAPIIFDAEEAHAMMHKAGLRNAYADGLVSGLWPSMDVLPVTEQSQVGIALQGFTQTF